MPATPTHRKLFWLALFLMAAGALGLIIENRQGPQSGLPEMDVEIGGQAYHVEVALTPEQQATGLMHRERLDPGKGMLFIYPRAQEMSFWMKDTKIPLDILYFDEQGKLVAQHRSVPPCQASPCATYPSGRPARYVLELAGGQAERLQLATGATLRRVGGSE